MYDVTDVLDLIVRYFSSRIWMALFIASTVYLFFRLKTFHKRAAAAALIAFCLVVNSFVIRIFTMLDENSTYYRNLWAIPSMLLIGIAVIDGFMRLPRWYYKTLAVVAFSAVIYFVNQEPIRCRALVFTEDGKMVTADSAEIAEKLEAAYRQARKRALFVLCPPNRGMTYGALSTELSLYGGEWIVYGPETLTDSEHDGVDEISREHQDARFIMEGCCAKGMDYVVVPIHELTESSFREIGCEPVLKTTSYLLYRCEGYAGYTQDINARGLICRRDWHDEQGNPVENEDGYHTLEFEYLDRLTVERYSDLNGAPCNTVSGGYARIEHYFTNFGALRELRYYDASGGLTARLGNGYAVIQYAYQGRRMISRTYYNEREEMFDYTWWNPHSVDLYFYDERGNLIREAFLDKEGNPAPGYDEIIREFDDDDHVLTEGYYLNGRLVNRGDKGYALAVWEYNEDWKVTGIKYFDADRQPVDYTGP